jgi:hypothetical protein
MRFIFAMMAGVSAAGLLPDAMAGPLMTGEIVLMPFEDVSARGLWRIE